MVLLFSLNTVAFNQYHEDLYIGDAAKMAIKTPRGVRVDVPLASASPGSWSPRPAVSLSIQTALLQRGTRSGSDFSKPAELCTHSENGEGQQEKSLSDAFAWWIMNSSRRSTHYNWNRLIINYAQSMSKRTSSECLMCGNSNWTLPWHFVISTCQQGAQA